MGSWPCSLLRADPRTGFMRRVFQAAGLGLLFLFRGPLDSAGVQRLCSNLTSKFSSSIYAPTLKLVKHFCQAALGGSRAQKFPLCGEHFAPTLRLVKRLWDC